MNKTKKELFWSFFGYLGHIRFQPSFIIKFLHINTFTRVKKTEDFVSPIKQKLSYKKYFFKLKS